MRIVLSSPRGFCAGVERAIAIVENAITKYGAPIYVRHEVVHNQRVIEELKRRGVIFVEHISEVPEGSVLIFSAHGVSQKVRSEATSGQFTLLDATCPLVTKVHREVIKKHIEGHFIIMIGHMGHPEVEGTMGQIPNRIVLIQNLPEVDQLSINEKKMCYVTQTTLSLDETQEIINALKKKYPHIQEPKTDDICYATQNRQNAVKKLVRLVDCIIVIGSQNSSNSKQLKNVAQKQGCQTYMINSEKELNLDWLRSTKVLGITAGASAPETLVTETIEKIRSQFPHLTVEELEAEPERISFPLPKTSHSTHPEYD